MLRIAAILPLIGLGISLLPSLALPRQAKPVPVWEELDRSPVDLTITRDGRAVLTVNQTSGTISLLDLESGKVLDEQPCGERPSALVLTSDETRVLVSGTYSGDVHIFRLGADRLTRVGTIKIGFEPRGLAVSPDDKRAYVALTAQGAVAVLDLRTLVVTERVSVGRWPRYLALSPDGSRLAVGVNGDGGVAVVDTRELKRLWTEDFAGINLGWMQIDQKGEYVYFPYMVYRQNPITPGNIRIGWVLASRIARVRLDRPARREAISLDPQGMAISDPHGLALSPDGQSLVSAASGTHELLVYQLPGLPFQDYGGPGDHIDPKLLKDTNRFHRIPLGGRPMTVRYTSDGSRILIANYLDNSVQIVDPASRGIVRTLSLGGPKRPSLARQGEALFVDGKRSLEQWYSCHSCHYEGHTNSLVMDTRNDGRDGNFKTVLSLRNVTHTPPYTWHGWQKELDLSIRKSMTDSMLGKEPTEAEVKALSAYLETLKPPPNPYRQEDGSLTPEAQRGEKIFRSVKAGCSTCHSGPYFTDGKIHDVGLGKRDDAFKGFNTPSLIGLYDRVLLLHDGRATSLEEVLKGPHNPANLIGEGELTADELADLIAYLKSL